MTALAAGLADPVIQSQQVFRAVLDAMARPGTIHDLPFAVEAPAPLDPATAALVLALADAETPLWPDSAARTAETTAWMRFHCGCPLAPTPHGALFAVIAAPWAMPALSAFAQGSDEYPDRSATLVIQVPSLADGPAWSLSGPGIKDRATLAPAALPADFAQWLADNHTSFPRGIDMVFTCGSQLAALPRSTRVEA